MTTRRLHSMFLMGAALVAAHGAKAGAMPENPIERQVRRELITLPFYSLFDNLSFRVEGDTVTLMGQVTRPVLKTGAENVVKRLERVGKVVNEIEVLPLSPHDDGIRVGVYRAVYGHSAMFPYALRAMPPVHIIVKNGNVTLEGVVATAMQKNVAGIEAGSVPGVFSVTNNLRVEDAS